MKKKLIMWFTLIAGLSGVSFFAYKKFFVKKQTLPYMVQKPERRTIRKIIDTTGKISVAEKIKKGSLVTGIIKKLYVDENEVVKKGQLLAEIDTGKSDADVRQAEGALEKASAQVDYLKNYYKRQEVLYKSGQLAKDTFEQIKKEYLQAKASHKIAKAQFDKATEEFGNTKIFAPASGVVIKVGIAEGERVTTDLDATVLFEIAKDITKMEAFLEIDETNVGHVKVDQKVKFTVDSFPNRTFKTKISEISYSPKKRNGNLFYKAIIPVDNSEKILRPGLSIDAKISVAKTKNALALTSQAFMVSSKVLEQIAKDLNYSFNPVDKKALKKKKKSSSLSIQTVWVVQKNGAAHSFVEKIVTTNITDDIYFEITSGLAKDDEVIIDVIESDYMEEIYKKIFCNRF